jgi:DNA-binding winged helix-turn-helix (wHTH) protein/predicted ATPase
MPADAELCFEPYRLEVRNAQLWCGTQVLRLTVKAFGVLRYLVEHAGQLVTKDDLLAAVWPGMVVGEGVLTNCVGELRKALGDAAQAPRFIATVHGRGYRFIAPVTLGSPLEVAAPSASAAVFVAPAAPPLLVGRETEVHVLQHWLEQVLRGQRHVVFVTGEAGIGKTTVVDAFLATTASAAPLWVAWGQCLAQYGVGEAYLPVLDALGRLCRTPGRERLIALLSQYAPTWLIQMPALLSPAALDEVQRKVLGGATRERMLRELAEALEVVTAEHPLVLVLEDLHWSDHATLDLLAWLAQRRESARLLLIGTYRPVEVIVQEHPLRVVKQELALHGQCVELCLEGLSEAAVAAYLMARFPGWSLPAGLARLLHRRTEGQPLFMVQAVDAWVQQGWIHAVGGQWVLQVGLETLETGVPESVRQMIVQQFEGLSPAEQAILETASVVGVEFSTVAVATGVERAIGEVEAACEALVRRGQFLRGCGVEEWPDGTVAGRYAFLHALHQHVVYQQVPVGRGIQLHGRLGARLEAGYGERADERAAELALHFAAGRNYTRAVYYRRQAAANALGRWAYQEAIAHLTTGLTLLTMLPDTSQRTQQEIDLHLTLGPALIATHGLADSEVIQTYARAHALCQQVDNTPQLFPTLRGLWRFYQTRGALLTAREVGEQLVQLAQRTAAPLHCLEAHDALGTTLFHLGDYTTARAHLAQGIAGTDPMSQRDLGLRPDVLPGVRCLAIAATTLWCLGYPTQAIERSQEALAMAQALAHPYSLGFAQHQAALLYARCRQAPTVQRWAEVLLTLATAQGFPLYVGLGTCWQGWALAMQGRGEAGLAQLQQGLAAVLATGQRLGQPLCLVLLVETAGHVGHVEEGLRLLAEALAVFEATGRGDMLAEVYRLQGELLLRQAIPDAAQAEACFHEALAISRRQQATSWALRAAMSLSRLWQRQDKREEAHQLLAPLYGWFTEGFDTADLQEAKALLEELGV